MASNWFRTNEVTQKLSKESDHGESSMAETLAPFSQEFTPDSPKIGDFFVPGWKGESLISKNVKKFNEILDKFHKDAKKFFYEKEALSRKLKISIYNEFLSFAEFKAINCTELDHYTTFWSEIKNEDSKYHDQIESFLNILSFRIAVVYLLKIRFILVLQEKTHSKFDIKNIYYPNSYFTKMFKTASSTEILTKAFEQNVFSWYRPSEGLKNQLITYKSICSNLKITEIIKTISIKSETILKTKTDYSHSISHKSFGLFINSLLINFPVWLRSLSQRQQTKFKTLNNNLEIISTKFAGDNLESMALSHWLAQDTNKNLKWEQILCPDFKKQEFDAGLYLKTINELQFLTFLAEIANIQNIEPKTFISKVINSHLFNRKNSNDIQKSLMLNDTNVNFSTYDRVVLNLSNFPKNNPQHFLFNQILMQRQFIKENGLIYVITSKKLFVPSQKTKIDNLLQEFKVEGIFNLEEVKGRGEIGSYIYIFSCRNKSLFENKSFEKQTCLNFRLSAQLKSFQEFSTLTKLTQDFYTSNIHDVPPLYHKSEEEFRIEFYQDAIVNGQLIHSSSKDSSKVTHPLFFKQLMGLCNSLDYFFDIQNVDFNETEEEEEEDSLFNFSQSFKREKSPYILIVDQRTKDETRLEVISSSTLEAKAYDYGHALCSYFYAYPKWPNLNIITVKDFFESSIGKQIVNLTFSNEIRKVKGNLNKLLIPKYFISQEQIPEHILPGLNLLSSTPKELLTIHPTEIERNYKNIKGILPSIINKYPAHTLNLMASFKRCTINAMEIIGCTKKTASINFSNPILKTPLLLSKTYPIYPDNKDVYIEFNTDALEQIHKPLSRVKRSTKEKEGYTSYLIDLYAEDTRVLTIYSDESMVSFIEFLLNNILNVSISKILQSVQVPMLEDLKSILLSYNSLNRSLTDISTQLPKDLDLLINQTIFNNK